jgi:hypothetical protein
MKVTWCSENCLLIRRGEEKFRGVLAVTGKRQLGKKWICKRRVKGGEEEIKIWGIPVDVKDITVEVTGRYGKRPGKKIRVDPRRNRIQKGVVLLKELVWSKEEKANMQDRGKSEDVKEIEMEELMKELADWKEWQEAGKEIGKGTTPVYLQEESEAMMLGEGDWGWSGRLFGIGGVEKDTD